jgi:hypothetical protein
VWRWSWSSVFDALAPSQRSVEFRTVIETHVLETRIEILRYGPDHAFLPPEEAIRQGACAIDSVHERVLTLRVLDLDVPRDRYILTATRSFPCVDFIDSLLHLWLQRVNHNAALLVVQEVKPPQIWRWWGCRGCILGF